MDRPPLGVMPQNIWKEQRAVELSRAIHEHLRVGGLNCAALREWIHELDQHVASLQVGRRLY